MACLLSRATRDDPGVFVAECTYDCPTMLSTPPTSIEPPDSKAVIELISPDRLNPYLTACAGDSTAALALYRWNSGLAAAFFEPLGHLEIMLRNALDARLVARQQRRDRTTEWYVSPMRALSGSPGDNTPASVTTIVLRGRTVRPTPVPCCSWRTACSTSFRPGRWWPPRPRCARRQS